MGKQNFLKLPQWLRSNAFYRTKIKTDSGDDQWANTPCVPVHPYDANVISSENEAGYHTLFLDLDQEHWYTKSTNEGHGHLAIRTHLRIDQLKEIIDVLVKHNVLQQGIKRQVDERGCLTLRMPGMRKDVKEDNMSFEELAEQGRKPRPVDEKTDTRYHLALPVDTEAMKDFFDSITAKDDPF